jgi:transposase-like protein
MEKIPIIRYSEAFKKQVVSEYEQGATASSLREKYGIKGRSTINTWLKKYGREGSRYKLMVIQKPEEQNRVKQLEKRVQQLEQVLAQVMVEKLMLESLVEVIEEQEGPGLKKNIGRQSLNGRSTKARRKE